MRFIVRYAKKHCKYKFELFEEYQPAWDRYNALKGEVEAYRLTFIKPANQEVHDQILEGTFDEA